MELDRCYALSPNAVIRPERFGGLAYRYDNRHLYFLHSRELVEFIGELDGLRPLNTALDSFLVSRGLAQQGRQAFIKALAQLQNMGIIHEL